MLHCGHFRIFYHHFSLLFTEDVIYRNITALQTEYSNHALCYIILLNSQLKFKLFLLNLF